MRILFHLLEPGYLRNYESTVLLLTARGHEVHIVYSRPPDGSDPTLPERLALVNDGVTVGVAAVRPHDDAWRGIAWSVRALADASRFLHPRYADAPLLRARPLKRLEKRISGIQGSPIARAGGRFVERLRGRPDATSAARLVRFFSALEWGVPPSPEITRFIESIAPDAVLVTPLVNVASDQVDVVKSAHALGIPVGLCVASWDNLTNKGLIRVEPEAVFLWNEIQFQEATELHGIEPGRITITGAQRFDEWFEREPSRSAEEFATEVGLDPTRPFLLFVCSSRFIAPDEVPFVRRWIEALRACGDPTLRTIGILVRPHPQNSAQWQDRPLADLANVAVWPESGTDPVDAQTRADFFDSIAHSEAVVGINTSSLIEAAIIGRGVFTVRAPEFHGTQEGTLHFHYLLHGNGGFLHTANTLVEHVEQIGATLADPDRHRKQTREFVASFIRPHGLERAATPRLADAIERLEGMAVRSTRPWWAIGARLILRVAALGARFPVSRPGSGSGHLRVGRALSGARWLTARFAARFASSRAADPIRVLTRRHPPLHDVLRRWLTLLVAPLAPAPAASRSDEMKRRFRRSLRQGDALVVGPWTGDEATELLYWIPFVRWGLRRYDMAPDKVVAASVHGTAEWYGDAASSFLRVESAAELPGSLDRAAVLRPKLLIRFCEPFWEGRGPIREIVKHADYVALRSNETGASGIVVDLELTSAFRPRDPAAASGLESTLRESAASSRPLAGSPSERTAAIASAERVVAGFGRDTHIGIFSGVPTIALYTEPDIHRPSLALAHRVARRLGTPFTALSLSELAALAEIGLPREPVTDR